MSVDFDTDEADRARSCTRKKGYPLESVARLSVASIRRTSPTADVRVYACRHCGMWHVGGTPLRDRAFRSFGDDAPPSHDPYGAARGRGPRKPDRRRQREGSYSRSHRRPRRERDREETET